MLTSADPDARCGARRPEIDADTPFGGCKAGRAARLGWRLATARSLSARWRRRIRKVVAPRAAGPFDVEADGVRLRLYPAENHCDRTVMGRGHLPERPERTLIAPVLAPGMVFVDVGANVGVYSLFVSAATGGQAKVVALEPHPRTFAKFDVNCRLNGFANVVRINAGAAEAESETALFSDGGGNIGSASLLRAAGGGKEEIAVRLRPLAAVLAELRVERVDLLKIDVEGFEDRALLPLFAVAPPALWPHHVLLETVHAGLWRRDLVAALGEFGYECTGRTDENLLLRRRARGGEAGPRP